MPSCDRGGPGTGAPGIPSLFFGSGLDVVSKRRREGVEPAVGSPLPGRETATVEELVDSGHGGKRLYGFAIQAARCGRAYGARWVPSPKGNRRGADISSSETVLLSVSMAAQGGIAHLKPDEGPNVKALAAQAARHGMTDSLVVPMRSASAMNPSTNGASISELAWNRRIGTAIFTRSGNAARSVVE